MFHPLLNKSQNIEPSLGHNGESLRDRAEFLQGGEKLCFHGATSFPGHGPKVMVGHTPFGGLLILSHVLDSVNIFGKKSSFRN